MKRSRNVTISIIAAIDENNALGKDNKLLWHIPEDLKRFKDLTSGHPIIMGRRTFESIGKVLSGRLNIVVTRSSVFVAEGAMIRHSLEEALELAKNSGQDEIFIIGGAQIYRQALPLTDKLYLTLVPGKHDADAYFPEYPEFKTVVRHETVETEYGEIEFVDLVR